MVAGMALCSHCSRPPARWPPVPVAHKRLCSRDYSNSQGVTQPNPPGRAPAQVQEGCPPLSWGDPGNVGQGQSPSVAGKHFCNPAEASLSWRTSLEGKMT